MNKPVIISDIIRGDSVKPIGLHPRVVAEFAESYISTQSDLFALPELVDLVVKVDSYRASIAKVPSPFMEFWYGRSTSAREIALMLRNAWPYVYRYPEAYDLLASLIECHDETCKPYTDDVMKSILQGMAFPGDFSSFDDTIGGLDGEAFIWNHTFSELAEMVSTRRKAYLMMSLEALLNETTRLDQKYSTFNNHELCDFYVSFSLYDLRESLLREKLASSGLMGDLDARPRFLS